MNFELEVSLHLFDVDGLLRTGNRLVFWGHTEGGWAPDFYLTGRGRLYLEPFFQPRKPGLQFPLQVGFRYAANCPNFLRQGARVQSNEKVDGLTWSQFAA